MQKIIARKANDITRLLIINIITMVVNKRTVEIMKLTK